MNSTELKQTKEEMDKVIGELEKRGIDVNSHLTGEQDRGLGDVVEDVLT